MREPCGAGTCWKLGSGMRIALACILVTGCIETASEPDPGPYVILDVDVDTSDPGTARVTGCAGVDSPLCLAVGTLTAGIDDRVVTLIPQEFDLIGEVPVAPGDDFLDITWTLG